MNKSELSITEETRVINILAEEGFGKNQWIHDQDINGAWYGRIGNRVALIECDNHFVLHDHGSKRKFKKIKTSGSRK